MCLGTLGTIVRTWDESGVPMALVDAGSKTEAVCLLAAPNAEEGDSVLVHMGFVVEVLDTADAAAARGLRNHGIEEDRS